MPAISGRKKMPAISDRKKMSAKSGRKTFRQVWDEKKNDGFFRAGIKLPENRQLPENLQV